MLSFSQSAGKNKIDVRFSVRCGSSKTNFSGQSGIGHLTSSQIFLCAIAIGIVPWEICADIKHIDVK